MPQKLTDCFTSKGPPDCTEKHNQHSVQGFISKRTDNPQVSEWFAFQIMEPKLH